MNSKIEELVKKANEYEKKLGKGIGISRDEKLVELIVRECGKSCTLQADEDDMFSKFGVKPF